MNNLLNEIEPVNNASFVNNEDISDQLLVKRTELSDIVFFSEDQSQSKKEYCNFFQIQDLIMAYETSIFCMTVIDSKNTSYVGLFIFNDSPFSMIKKEGYEITGGSWEEWFISNYEDLKIDGKNSLWLTYFYFTDAYNMKEEIQKKIFHKVHLSLYTTLPIISSVLLAIPKFLNQEIYRELTEVDNTDAAFSPFYSTKILVSYDMYHILNEIQNSELAIYLNIRDSVFPPVEIRIGAEEDHDDLEDIFKNQTPPEVVSRYENYFIANMIAEQDINNKVLVIQVEDKAIGMLAISTDVNVNLLINSFNLEKYDNLLSKDYMKAVEIKRNMIVKSKALNEMNEKKELMKKYHQEILSSEIIPQRIYLHKTVENCERDKEFLKTLEDIEKKDSTLNSEKVVLLINGLILNFFSIRYPNLEQFEGKIKIDQGGCLLQDKFKLFIETLEFFGLPRGYMKMEGHWVDWKQREAEKKAQKESMKKKYDNKQKKTKNSKKEAQESQLPSHFDISPLIKALKFFIRSGLRTRSLLRKIIKENKKLVASFFVDEKGDPCETKCFDVMSLSKKLSQNKIIVPEEIADIIGPTLLCFGDLPYDKKTVMKVPDNELRIIDLKKDKQKKPKKEKKTEVKEVVKKEAVPVPTIVYEVSINDFFNSLETSFKYDKLLYEMEIIESELFFEEYQFYMKQCEVNDNNNDDVYKSDYLRLRDEELEKNLKDSEEQLSKYSEILDNYTDENLLPPTPHEVLNAFCVKLFFIEQAFESRSVDFLLHAFEQFPEKDYLIITQPHTYYENALLDYFIKIDKRMDSLFNDMLYLIHRESLVISLMKASIATEEDLKCGRYLLDNFETNSSEIYNICRESINNINSKFSCIVVKVNHYCIGLFLISKEANINYYDSHFNIRDFINIDKISKYFHSRIVFSQIHKHFVQFSKLIIKEIMRVTNKISLYCEIYPDIKNYPYIIKDLTFAKNRKFPQFIQRQVNYHVDLFESEKIRSHTDEEFRDEFDGIESEFCLAIISKKMLFDSKLSNNHRIVVVGGSDTGISFIESLLSIRYLEFTHIYLISPGGLLYHHIEDEIQNLRVSINNYQIHELKKLLLEHRIKIINSKVIDIKPVQKYVQLEDKSVLTYDYLVLTLGLQDKLNSEITRIVHDQIDAKFQIKDTNDKSVSNAKELQNLNISIANMKNQINVISIDDPNLYSIFSPTEKILKSLRKNPQYEIILYGRNLNLICFIQGLIKREVPPSKIKLVIPNLYAHVDYKDDKNFKKDPNIAEEISFSNSTSFETLSELENFIHNTLINLGVKIYHNYNFTGVNINETIFSLESYKFTEEGTDKTEDLTANIIVTGGLIDVDKTVFNFIHNNKLVYNGRAIIKQNFMTANEFIFAAGRLCEFSQKYFYTDSVKLLKLESYNSREVGYALAKSFLQTIDSQLNQDIFSSDLDKLPNFYLPLPLFCYLPTDLSYIKISAIKETNVKIKNVKNREPLIYDNLINRHEKYGCYLKFTFNAFGIIDSIVYVGYTKISYQSIISLVGLHENYLNDLLTRYEANLVEDIPEFLSENWSMALYSDNFSKLVIKLKGIIQDKEEIENIQNIISTVVNNNLSLDRKTLKNFLLEVSDETKKKIELEILRFLSDNRNQLPFYHIPILG